MKTAVLLVVVIVLMRAESGIVRGSDCEEAEGCVVRGVREDERGSLQEAAGDTDDRDHHDKTTGVEEGRGKKLKKLLPFLLMLLKMQYEVSVLVYFVIALIAKLALLKSSLALVLSGVLLLWKLLTSQHVISRTEVKLHENSLTKTHVGGGGVNHGYQGGYESGGWNSYGAAVDQHSAAYRGQKPMGR
ncbi:uncharacterized protein LOC128986636 [Macrosteles quadrilineatus]|uniref:uncharacterized protein LOC128986636 n=1 Tax=Macrosteles quadrilineatus TaxID=74068 RepID=UPI0023E0FB7C|nr:uncharacterized protein LOC128986636 [Macrosteles quadrilineatus]